jgi:hypothetical protein
MGCTHCATSDSFNFPTAARTSLDLYLNQTRSAYAQNPLSTPCQRPFRHFLHLFDMRIVNCVQGVIN